MALQGTSTYYGRQYLTNWVCRVGSDDWPFGQLYLGLHTTAAGVDGDGAVEVSVSGYARQGIDFDAAAITPLEGATDDDDAVALSQEVVFPNFDGTSMNFVELGFYLASSGGKPVVYASGPGALAYVAGRELVLPAGWIKLSLPGIGSPYVSPAGTRHFRRNLLDHMTGRTSYQPSLWLALLDTQSLEAETKTEFSGDGYARVDISSIWNAAALGAGPSCASNAQANFPTVTGTAWPSSKDGAIFDASSGGNWLAGDPVPAGSTPGVPVGDRLVIQSGNATMAAW